MTRPTGVCNRRGTNGSPCSSSWILMTDTSAAVVTVVGAALRVVAVARGCVVEGEQLVGHGRDERHVVLDDQQRAPCFVPDAAQQRRQVLRLGLGDTG